MDSKKQISKTSIILTDADKWDDWLGNVRRIALSADIWEHIDPSKDEALLIKPPLPIYGQVKATATTFAEFTADEKEEWHRLNQHFAEENDSYKRKRKAMNDLVGRIQDTVDMKGISYLANCDTLYEMLKKLRTKYSVTEETREIELAAKFRRQLNAAPKNRNIEDWLSDIERTHAQCDERKLLGTKPGIIVKEFIDAIASIDQSFADQWDSIISRGELKNIDFPKIIEHFRNWRLQRAQRKPARAPASFPATFQGQATENNENNSDSSENSNNDRKKRCLYGQEHL